MKTIFSILILIYTTSSFGQMKDGEEVDAQGIDFKFEINDTKGKNKEVADKEVCLFLTNTNDAIAKVSFTVAFIEVGELMEESANLSFEIKPGKTIKGKAKGLCWEFTKENLKKFEAGTLELELYEYEVSK